MDLVDLIHEKRFLGQEFLAWLWYKSEERGGSVEVPGRGDVGGPRPESALVHHAGHGVGGRGPEQPPRALNVHLRGGKCEISSPAWGLNSSSSVCH